MEEICNRCVHKTICEMGAAPRDVSVITGCYNFRAERPKTNADRFHCPRDCDVCEYSAANREEGEEQSTMQS